MAVGVRPLGILDEMFDSLERQVSPDLSKRVKRLEQEYTRLATKQNYSPHFRSKMAGPLSEHVYAALAAGPKTMKELARMFGKSYGSIAYAGSRLRGAGKITTIFRSGRAKWVRVSAAQAFIPAREAIVAALGTGPKTVPALAQETGKGISTVKSALHRHLLSDGTVTRSQFGILRVGRGGTAVRF